MKERTYESQFHVLMDHLLEHVCPQQQKDTHESSYHQHNQHNQHTWLRNSPRAHRNILMYQGIQDIYTRPEFQYRLRELYSHGDALGPSTSFPVTAGRPELACPSTSFLFGTQEIRIQPFMDSSEDTYKVILPLHPMSTLPASIPLK